MYPLMYRLATTVDEGAIERRATLPTVPNIVRCRAKDMFFVVELHHEGRRFDNNPLPVITLP